MNTFIEQNKKLLIVYYRAARVGGWVFLLLSCLAIAGHSAALTTRLGDMDEFCRYWRSDVPWGMLSNVLPTGLLALGVSQLIWLLLETDRRPRWLLRHAHQLLYLYTAILVGYYLWAGIREVQIHFNDPYDFPWRMLLLAAFIAVKLLTLVGAAELLRRLLPMLEESRTLV